MNLKDILGEELYHIMPFILIPLIIVAGLIILIIT